MVHSCAAYNCTNQHKKNSGISFHRFPLQNQELLSKWLSAVKRDKFVPSIHHTLCSVHFTESCFWKTSGNRLLKADAVPSIFDFSTHRKKTDGRCKSKKKLQEDNPETSEGNERCTRLANKAQMKSEADIPETSEGNEKYTLLLNEVHMKSEADNPETSEGNEKYTLLLNEIHMKSEADNPETSEGNERSTLLVNEVWKKSETDNPETSEVNEWCTLLCNESQMSSEADDPKASEGNERSTLLANEIQTRSEGDNPETIEGNESCTLLVNEVQMRSEHNYSTEPTKKCKVMEKDLERKNTQIKTLRYAYLNYKRKTIRQESSINRLKLEIKELKELNEKNLVNKHAHAESDNSSKSLREMVNCCVAYCGVKKVRGCSFSFHHFPTDPEQIAKWINVIQRYGGNRDPSWVPTKNSVICSKHFKESDFSTSTSRRILLPRSVPSIFINYPSETRSNEEETEENPTEIPSKKKRSRTNEVCLENETVQQELRDDFINQLTEDNAVNPEFVSNDEIRGEELITDETREILEDTAVSAPLCRLCASPNEDMVAIFENEQSDFVLLEKIHAYLPIMITAEDLLPTTVCGQCINKLEICHNLVQGCLDADAVLKTMLEVQNSTQISYDAENQCESEETYNQNTACEDGSYEYMDNCDATNEMLADSEQLDLTSALAKDTLIGPYTLNTAHYDTENSVPQKNEPELNKKIYKGRIKPKLKVVIVKMKNLQNITDKAELQKTVHLAINEKMKQQILETNKKSKLSEMASGNNQHVDPDAGIPGFEDGDTDVQENHEIIASDHTYTLKESCQHCQQKFTTDELWLHQQTSKQCSNALLCEKCLCVFESNAAMDRHYENCYITKELENKENYIETLDYVNQENDLGADLEQAKDIENHIEKLYDANDENNFETDFEQVDNTCDSYKEDVEVEVLDVDIKTNKRPGTFKLNRGCHIKFPKGFEHINTVHQAKILTAINKIIDKKVPKQETNVRIKGPDGWKCRLCSEILPTSRAYRLHRLAHTPRPFPCELCKRTFTSEKKLKQHLSFHSNEKSHMCEYCGKIFKLKDSLKIHYFSHGKSEKVYKCNECGKAFGSKYRYNQHLLRHGKATYLCDICGKKMKYPGSLRCHKLHHQQKILYECTMCGKIYNSRQGLNTHMQIHSRKSPFACNKCGKHFETHVNLSEHKLIQHNNILSKCHICGKCFTVRLQLKKHIKRHQITFKYTCKQCQITFTNIKELLFHRRSHSSIGIIHYEAEGESVP